MFYPRLYVYTSALPYLCILLREQFPAVITSQNSNLLIMNLFRHYLDTTTLQVIHSTGYNSKIVLFMNPAKPGPQGDAFYIYIYMYIYVYTLL